MPGGPLRAGCAVQTGSFRTPQSGATRSAPALGCAALVAAIVAVGPVHGATTAISSAYGVDVALTLDPPLAPPTGINVGPSSTASGSGTSAYSDTETVASLTVSNGSTGQILSTVIATPTITDTPTVSSTATDMPSRTDTPTATGTATSIGTATGIDTPTRTQPPTATDSATATPTISATATTTHSATATVAASDTFTAAPMPSPTPSGSASRTPTSTSTPTATATPSASLSPTASTTPGASATPAASATASPSPSATPPPSSTPSAAASPTPRLAVPALACGRPGNQRLYGSGTADMPAGAILICRRAGRADHTAPCSAPDTAIAACGTNAAGQLRDDGLGCAMSAPLALGQCAVAWDPAHDLCSQPCCVAAAAPAPALSGGGLRLGILALIGVALPALARRSA